MISSVCQSQNFEKKIWWPKFGSLVFLEIAYNDSLQQCLTTSRGRIHEKKFYGPKFGSDRSKLGPKLSFLPFSQVSCVSFFLDYIDDSWKQCLIIV